MAIFTHGVEKLLYELNFNNDNTLLLLYPKLSSLRNDCSINLNLSDHVFAKKYDDRRLQNKERINVLFVMI